MTTASAYRCANHPDVSVSWRGTGCPVCDNLRRKPKKKRTDNTDKEGSTQ